MPEGGEVRQGPQSKAVGNACPSSHEGHAVPMDGGEEGQGGEEKERENGG